MRDANFLERRITYDTLCTYQVSSNSGGVTCKVLLNLFGMTLNRNLCAYNKVCSKAPDEHFTILNHSQLNWVWDW